MCCQRFTHIASAIERGASAIVCERIPEAIDEAVKARVPFIVVPDAAAALGRKKILGAGDVFLMRVGKIGRSRDVLDLQKVVGGFLRRELQRAMEYQLNQAFL